MYALFTRIVTYSSLYYMPRHRPFSAAKLNEANTMAAKILPPDFLLQPAQDIVAEKIDFTKTDLPENAPYYACVMDNVLSHEECLTMLRAAMATTDGVWERAMVNIGGGRQAMYTDTRNCGRIIWDSKTVAELVWQRIENVAEVQEILRLDNRPLITGIGPWKRKEIWKLTRPNERMRFLKYVGGEYFRPHCDGVYETPDKKERTYFTLHLYLNDAGMPPEEELKKLSAAQRKEVVKAATIGGSTTFHSDDMRRRFDVQPKTGRVLLFQHRDLLHSGDDVEQGVKFTMRTDLLYTKEEPVAGEKV